MIRFPSTSWPCMNALPRSSTLIAGGCPGGVGGVKPGIFGIAGFGMPGAGGAGGGAGWTVAVFFRWSSRIDCPVAGLEITDVLPESTRVLPSAARENLYDDWAGGSLLSACFNVLAYPAVTGGNAAGGVGPIGCSDYHVRDQAGEA